MRKTQNKVHIEGRIYSSDLEIKEVKNETSPNFGKEYIGGTLHVAVDEDGLNVIPVTYSYVTETTSTGKKNATYAVLKRIIEENKLWTTVGKDEAFLVKIDTSIALNDFYNQNDELISSKRCEGGFASIVKEITSKEADRNKFTVDMLINNMVIVEADPEKNIEEDYAKIKGAVFNFRNEILPIELILRNPKGIEYFENIEVSAANPIFTEVYGAINCFTKKIEKKEETAFGECAVKSYEIKQKEWLMIGAKLATYEIDEEGDLTPDELKKAIQDREIHLAEVKQRNEEYKNSKTSNTTQAQSTQNNTTSAKANNPFNF